MRRVISGSSHGVASSTLNHTPITMVEIELDAGKVLNQDIPNEYNGFIYLLEGRGEFGKDKTEAEKGEVLLLGDAAEDKDSEIQSKQRALTLSPLWYGNQFGKKL
jgi:redox-sensitive bicupin YhaK (pirin superfamily)